MLLLISYSFNLFSLLKTYYEENYEEGKSLYFYLFKFTTSSITYSKIYLSTCVHIHINRYADVNIDNSIVTEHNSRMVV